MWPTVATTALSSSSATEPPPSAPFGRGLRDVPLAPSHRQDHAEPPLYGTSPSPAALVLDLYNLAPVKSSWWDQLRVRARVWAFVLLSDGLGVGGRILAVLDELSGRPKIVRSPVLRWGVLGCC